MMQGQLIVVSAPSGTGKTSLVRSIIDTMPDIKASISYTTRKPRPGEIDGVHYHFVSQKKFKEMIQNLAFLEYAIVHKQYYGTSLINIQRQRSLGIDMILDIDYQGAQKIKAQFPQALLVFILPPSMDILMKRLSQRGQDSPTVIEQRMAAAKNEITHAKNYDYLIVNEDFDYARIALSSVIQAGHFRHCVQERTHQKLLDTLMSEEV